MSIYTRGENLIYKGSDQRIKLNDHTWTVLFAIGCLTILEAIALYMNINGQFFSLIVGVIAVLAGYKAKDAVELFRNR